MYGRIAYMNTVISDQVSYYNNFHEPRNLLLAIARWRCIMEGVGGGGCYYLWTGDNRRVVCRVCVSSKCPLTTQSDIIDNRA